MKHLTLENCWIVITTINKPTEAINKYASICSTLGWQLLIVADAKTPDYPSVDGLKFLSLDDQKQYFPEYFSYLPINH